MGEAGRVFTGVRCSQKCLRKISLAGPQSAPAHHRTVPPCSESPCCRACNSPTSSRDLQGLGRRGPGFLASSIPLFLQLLGPAKGVPTSEPCPCLTGPLPPSVSSLLRYHLVKLASLTILGEPLILLSFSPKHLSLPHEVLL